MICCVGVVYSGEYDVCDVTLSVYPNRASLKNIFFKLAHFTKLILTETAAYFTKIVDRNGMKLHRDGIAPK
jgi:hypothetical protein